MNTAEAINALPAAPRDYAAQRGNDALASLNERLQTEIDYFERETGLRVVALKVTRDKEDDSLKALKAHVR